MCGCPFVSDLLAARLTVSTIGEVVEELVEAVHAFDDGARVVGVGIIERAVVTAFP